MSRYTTKVASLSHPADGHGSTCTAGKVVESQSAAPKRPIVVSRPVQPAGDQPAPVAVGLPAALSASSMQHPEADLERGCAEKGRTDVVKDQAIHEVPDYVRRGFIRKVYGILTVQVFLTLAIAAPFQFVSQQWLSQQVWLFQVALWGSLAIILAMSCCCQEKARKFPMNYVMLFGFTVFEAVVIGFITARYETTSVMLAGGATAAAFLGLTLYACFTKTDFTGIGPYVFVALIVLCITSFVIVVLPVGSTVHMLFAGCGALLFSMYIVYDTQLIVGGRHRKLSLGVDDYVFAALNLYLDFVNLFLFLLSILGGNCCSECE